MIASIVAAVREEFVCFLRNVGELIKKLTKPAPSVAAAAAGVAVDTTRTKQNLVVQNALLRQQLVVLRRSFSRPQLEDTDRSKRGPLSRLDSAWHQALHILRPDTLLRWHRRLFSLVWRRKSRPRGQPARYPQETIELIQRMASENRWGAERIRGELLKLGIRVRWPSSSGRPLRMARGPGF